MLRVILKIPNPMIRETRLPDLPAPFEAERETSLDELHGSLQRNLLRGRDQQMNVIGHDDEFMEEIFSFVAIVSKRVEQKICCRHAPEDWLTLCGDRRDKENAVGIHFLNAAARRDVRVCEIGHTPRLRVPKRNTGPKGRAFSGALYAALKGRSSTLAPATSGHSNAGHFEACGRKRLRDPTLGRLRAAPEPPWKSGALAPRSEGAFMNGL